MANSCPGCGADVAFPARPAVLLEGTCPECGKSSMVIEQGELAAGTPVAPGAIPLPIPCPQCGESLSIRASPDGAIGASCAACGAQTRYVPEGRAPREADSHGPPRSGPGPGERSFGRPSSRPCRECGGPLRFSTGPDGMTVGECASCGNRFTLPPRPEGGGRDRRPYDRGGSRSFPPGRGRTGGWSRGDDRRGPPRYGGGGGRFVRRGPPRDRDEDEERDDSRRRRRRPGPARE
jgi:hypothetical protein